MSAIRNMAGLAAAAFLIAGAASPGQPAAGEVDMARLLHADAEPGSWMTGGRDWRGSYYSPLAKINESNVQQLGYAWQYDLGQPQRGQEATPIVVDGVMYTSGTWGIVYALDAATGRELWRYDPQSEGFYARNPCCDLVNRGVAVWRGRVYVASVDGRLHAIDAGTGRKVWEADTIIDHAQPYSSTGAPQVAGKVVVIGNGGGDMVAGGVRGYVSAYDLTTGALKWRFYTVPPAPGHKLEHPELAAAEKSWDPQRDAKFRGGATVWDGTAYDPKLDLVYFGTGNPAPYDLRQVGPHQGDALYADSIIALHARTGRMAWYYQTTPHDKWDFDAVQKLVLADIKVGGRMRQVIMQASKNGFFYVLDRASGKLVSARDYAYVNWATGVDAATGRPVEAAGSDWTVAPRTIYPSWAGAHTWNPMAFNPRTGLVYIPVLDVPSVWIDLLHNGGSVKYINGFFTVNGIIADDNYDPGQVQKLFGPLPSAASIRAPRNVKPVRELLRAWDPVAQRVAWEQETSAGLRGYDGGVMSTAGNLVFQGRGSGELWVYAADTGKVLAKVQTGSHIMAAPMTYEVRGEQYVAVQVGYGGAAITIGTIPPASAAFAHENTNRVIAFKLGGGAVPEPPLRHAEPFPEPPPPMGDAAAIADGEVKFIQECSRCHVLGLSTTPDLRRLPAGMHATFKDIVLKGAYAPLGMERFDEWLTEEDADHIHAYLIDQAWQAYREQQQQAPK